MAITIQGALANTKGELSSEDLLEFLKDNLDDTEYFKLSPPPGAVMNAAFDWVAILGVTASAISIAQVFWSAYKKFIIPLRKRGNHDSFLFISLKNNENKRLQFSVGKQHDNEEEFIFEFSQEIEKLRINSNEQTVETEKTKLKLSGTWKKI